jgi:two-component sensor histidine kinase
VGFFNSLLGVSLEITDRKRAEERQRILVAELNHRVKNTLAIVQSLALQTHRATEDPAAFFQAFDARVRALAKAHDMLTENA